VFVGTITPEQSGREVFGWLRGTHQLRLTIIPKSERGGETKKLSNVASWYERFPELKILGQMMATDGLPETKSSQLPAWCLIAPRSVW